MTQHYSLFSVTGVELEYMIVDKTTLDIRPIADKLIFELAGDFTNEVELGRIAVSNELALHVIELKTNGPVDDLPSVIAEFHKVVLDLNERLKSHGACLMPSGAHPWLDPNQGVDLWPHGDRQIYHTFHRIFNCTGHGWSNLQSTHINLPFANDEEFNRLHNAIRLLLAIIPALTASTPFLEEKRGPVLDTRLLFYGTNQKKYPVISGLVIPEFIQNEAEYEAKILQPIYQTIAGEDPEGVLQFEWCNSRGAIARFDRHAIEIRICDIQECVTADLACVALIRAVLKHLIETTTDYLVTPLETEALKKIYDATIKDGMKTWVEHPAYLRQLGLDSSGMTARSMWGHLMEQVSSELTPAAQKALAHILDQGNLAERLVKKCGPLVDRFQLRSLYSKLCECLAKDQQL